MFGWIKRLLEPPEVEWLEYWVAETYLRAEYEGDDLVFPDGSRIPIKEWNPYKKPEQWAIIKQFGERAFPQINFNEPRTALQALVHILE